MLWRKDLIPLPVDRGLVATVDWNYVAEIDGTYFIYLRQLGLRDSNSIWSDFVDYYYNSGVSV